MPNKQAKINKRKRIIENKRLNREGRTAAQIERKKKRERARKNFEEAKPWVRR
jgi:hypothetical protein